MMPSGEVRRVLDTTDQNASETIAEILEQLDDVVIAR